MTKTLRMKFIVTAMTAVSILLILLIGGINIANFSVNERMTRDFLKSARRKRRLAFRQRTAG